MEQVQKLVEITNSLTELAASWQEIAEVRSFCSELWEKMVVEGWIASDVVDSVKRDPLNVTQQVACFVKVLSQMEEKIATLEEIISEKNCVIEDIQEQLEEYQ